MKSGVSLTVHDSEIRLYCTRDGSIIVPTAHGCARLRRVLIHHVMYG